jgi:magnesium-protoporphyrin O-methyltransferase
VAGRCDPRGCDRIFDARFAQRQADRYRKKGLSATARRLVDVLAAGGLEGATVLEIGGGVGEIGLELLRRGAASATNLELSPGYEDEAQRLIAEAGLTGRVQRRLADVDVEPAAVEPADVVVLNRVVCCYPDYAGLLGAAADHARRRLAFSFPPRNVVSRATIATQNTLLGWSGRQFRAFAHPPRAMFAVLTEHGLEPALAHAGPVWRVAAAHRPA